MDSTKLAAYKRYFIDLEPHMQMLEVERSGDDMMTLLALYPHAKDDMIRYEIVKRTGDTILAERLYKNTQYPSIQTRLASFVDTTKIARKPKEAWLYLMNWKGAQQGLPAGDKPKELPE